MICKFCIPFKGTKEYNYRENKKENKKKRISGQTFFIQTKYGSPYNKIQIVQSISLNLLMSCMLKIFF